MRESDLDADELRARICDFLWTGRGNFPAELRDEPHTLGWLQQYLGEANRKAAFAAHTGKEAKHSTATTTTQLYTPRWIADWLVERCLQASRTDVGPPSVLDPACGGGQMLLAAADALIKDGVPAADAYAALRGVDLDPHAVWACRESLKLAAFRATGERDATLEAVIDANIVAADGLFGGLARADIVITNPPYMGARSMPAELKQRLADYAPFHHDLYLAFIKRCADLGDVVGVLAQQTIWYLKRFEAARRAMLERGHLTDFAHLGHGVFDGLSGEKATVVAFVWAAGPGEACRFWDARAAEDKRAALNEPAAELDPARFEALPAAPLAFWLPSKLIDAFEGPRLGDVAEVPGSQNKTGNNAKFVRPIAEAPDDWVPYSKGGKFAPWWGNWDWAVDWSDEARSFYASNKTSNLLAEEYWFREGLCYSDFGGSHFNARWMPPGCLFDMTGPAIFVDDDDRDLLAALLVVLNSTPARAMLNALNPTLHYQVRDVRNLPLPADFDTHIGALAAFGHELVQATREALAGTSDPPLAAEVEADAFVARLYGSPELVEPIALRRTHHRLQGARR